MSRTLRSLRLLGPLSFSSARPFSSSTARLSSTFDAAPSPPRLPADQQAEFERLQREAEARLSTHTTTAPLSPSPPLQTSRHTTSPSTSSTSTQAQDQGQGQAAHRAQEVPLTAPAEAGEATFSGGIRKGAPPEFEGDRNPKTGEVGGPKNEPLRWGGGGDWSYNGRVTDF
jgi:hypothetical protein